MNNKIKKILILIIILSIVLIGLFCFLLKDKLDKNKDYKPYVTFESRIEKVEKPSIVFTTTYGWLQVQGTNIDYPVIKETNYAFNSKIDYIWRSNTYKEGTNRELIICWLTVSGAII